MIKYLLHLLKFIKSLLLRPKKTICWIKDDYKKDVQSKKFSSKHKLVWCAGLPKSGTTLIEEIFDNLPYVRQNISFNRIFYTGKLDHDHGISNEMFKHSPKDRFTFLKTHTHYEKKYEEIAVKNNLRIIISLRDLRDMLISRYYHILADKNHWLHNKIKDLNFTDGFIISLKVKETPDAPEPLNYYYFWILDWLKVSREKNFLVLWYEDYKNDPIKYINRILHYTNFEDFSATDIEKNIIVNRKKNISLEENLKIYGRQRKTLRKGKVGEWKDLFNKKIIDYFNSNIPGSMEKIQYKNDLKNN